MLTLISVPVLARWLHISDSRRVARPTKKNDFAAQSEHKSEAYLKIITRQSTAFERRRQNHYQNTAILTYVAKRFPEKS